MGLQDGGMLFIFTYFSILALLVATGDLARDIPDMSNSLNCIPDLVDAGQYVPSSGIGTQTCFDSNSDSSFSISTTQKGNDWASALISLVPGGREVTSIISQIWGVLDAVLLKGWYHIIEVLIGALSPLSPMIFYFYVVLQFVTDLWIFYFFLVILGIIKGGVSVK